MPVERIVLPPMDAHNERLLANVHPPDWVNPEPAPRYNLVVIGAGTAGLVTAMGAAGLGAKVALVERHLMGGDCLNVGCVPSKALISSARRAAYARDAAPYGVRAANVEVDFPAVMERMRRLRADISPNDSARRFRDAGIDVFLGEGKFTGRDTVEVSGKTLRFKRAVIATGARAATLPIPGLAEAGYLTNDTVFSLTERPGHLAIFGTGPIAFELAQTFRRLGCEVTAIDISDRIFPQEDPDAVAILRKRIDSEGIRFLLSCSAKKVEIESEKKVIRYEIGGKPGSIAADEILVAVGRAPNVEGLNLEAAGVEYGKHVVVNDYLQTTNPAIYAAGDVCMAWKFTHAADFAARAVIQNALFSLGPFGRKRLSALTMPWCTYTDPEIAHVGKYPHDLPEGVDTFTQSLEEVDRAIIEGETEGFVRIHVKKGTDKIVGATVVAPNAGDLISEISLAMVNGIGLGAIASVIHPYPTMADATRKLGDQYNRTRLTPTVKRLFDRWLAFRR